jgi:KUP system potassium uptake protein
VLFFASNLLKLFKGGWFPLVIGIGMFTLMLTWKQGRKLMAAAARRRHRPAQLPGSRLRQPADAGADGTAVFLTSESWRHAQRAAAQPEAQQGAARAQPVRHRAHHECRGSASTSALSSWTPLGHDCWQVALHFGFKNDPDVPER